ncbi:MAG: hypothetical protein JETT_3412 [Candidatus Jettenia ecosi]|uniref:Uncharacterized protein n=1 Tax=Candidatus Jettenia ecosi TaxID=2494326 RepID=A0A533Q6T7_9BACT|nr:MAG: hypothetical protein JETT_3412 [Candidatus Jettenia ecosi]
MLDPDKDIREITGGTTGDYANQKPVVFSHNQGEHKVRPYLYFATYSDWIKWRTHRPGDVVINNYK